MNQKNELTAADYAKGDFVLMAGASGAYSRGVIGLEDYAPLMSSLLRPVCLTGMGNEGRNQNEPGK